MHNIHIETSVEEGKQKEHYVVQHRRRNTDESCASHR